MPLEIREDDIRRHYQMLGHESYGVTELRTFAPKPFVAYADNEDSLVDLCRSITQTAPGIYVGVQPRPPHLFEKAPNLWRPAKRQPSSNCACDDDIEYITVCFFDIDVSSTERVYGQPASDSELNQTLKAAMVLSGKEELDGKATICCSGNGHYVVAPIIPVPVDDSEKGHQYKAFCKGLAEGTDVKLAGIRIDPVWNLSRVMRVIGTINRKGEPAADRPQRRAGFVSKPFFVPSMEVALRVLNMIQTPVAAVSPLVEGRLRCDLKKLENCAFIRWCKKYPHLVSEPMWFGLITKTLFLEQWDSNAGMLVR